MARAARAIGVNEPKAQCPKPKETTTQGDKKCALLA